MSSILRRHTERKDLGTVACFCDSGTGEAEMGKQGGLAGQPSLLHKPRAGVRPCLKTKQQRRTV